MLLLVTQKASTSSYSYLYDDSTFENGENASSLTLSHFEKS